MSPNDQLQVTAMQPKPTVLIVEDEDAISFAMSRYLRSRGFEVDCASELGAALSLLAVRRYRAVIADLRLTGVDDNEGLELLAEVKAKESGARTVLLTAYGTPELEARARDIGVDVIAEKPQRLADMAELLRGLLATAGA